MEPWEQYSQPQSATVAQEPWEQYAPQDPNFTQRIGQDFSNRKSMVNDLGKELLADPARGIVPTVLAAVGKGAYGLASDVITEGAKSVGNGVMAAKNALPDVTQRGAAAVGNYLGDSPIGDLALGVRDIAGWAGDKFNAASKAIRSANPIVADLGDATADVAMTGPGRAKEAPKPGITRDMVKTASQNAYDATKGTAFTPAVTDSILAHPENAIIKPAFGGTVLTSEDKAINSALGEYLPGKGRPATLQDFQKLDSSLGDKAAQAYVSGDANKGRILSGVQDKVRESLTNIDPKNITGNPEGVDALLNHAIPLWSTQAKMGDIEKIIDRANMMDNPSTGIKTGFRNYALNDGKMAQLPDNVQVLIRKAATTGKADDLLGVLGSRLNAIGGGVLGGVPGEVAGHVTSTLFRGARTGLKNSQAQSVLDALVEKVRPSVAKYLDGVPAASAAAPVADAVAEAPKLLTYQPPEKILAADSVGNIAPQTAEQQASGIMARRAAIATGLTPDVVAAQIKNMKNVLTPNFVQSDLGKALLANPKLLMSTVNRLSPDQGKALLNIVR